MSQRFGYPHASNSDYFIDNPEVVRQLDAPPTHAQPINSSRPADKREPPDGTGTNADDVRSERVLDYTNNGPRASDSVFDGTTMINEIHEPLIACDSLACLNPDPANPDSGPTPLDGSEQSTNVLKGIGAELCGGQTRLSVLQPSKCVAHDNSVATEKNENSSGSTAAGQLETCSPVAIAENLSATSVEVPEPAIAHSGANQISTTPADASKHELTTGNAPAGFVTPTVPSTTVSAEVTTARESSSAYSVRTGIEASEVITTAREAPSAIDLHIAIERTDDALPTVLDQSDAVATARGSSSNGCLVTAVETAADLVTAQERSECLITAREDASIINMVTSIEASEATHTAPDKSDDATTAREADIDAHAEVSTAVVRSDARAIGSTICLETSEGVLTARERSDQVITTCEVTTAIEADSEPSGVRTAVEKSEELVTAIETSETVHTALDNSDDVTSARTGFVDGRAEVAIAKKSSDTREIGSAICLLSAVEASEGAQTGLEKSEQLTTSHEVNTAIEAHIESSGMRTALHKSEELVTSIETSEAIHTAFDKSNEATTAREVVVDAQAEVATAKECSDTRAIGPTICLLAATEASDGVQTTHEKSDPVTTAHEVTTAIEADSEQCPSEMRTAVEKCEEFVERPKSTDEVLTARQGTEDVTTACESTSSSKVRTTIATPDAQLTAVPQTGAPSGSATSVPATSQPSFLVSVSATSSSVLTVVLLLCQILRTFIELVISPPATIPAYRRRPSEASEHVLTATEMPDEATACSDSCYKYEDAYANPEVYRTSSNARGLSTMCVGADETSGSMNQLNPSAKDLRAAATILRELALDAEVHTAVETPSTHDATDMRATA